MRGYYEQDEQIRRSYNRMAEDTPTSAPRRECWCVIHHARTPEERAVVVANLENARRTNDYTGMVLAMAQLSQCPADLPSADEVVRTKQRA